MSRARNLGNIAVSVTNDSNANNTVISSNVLITSNLTVNGSIITNNPITVISGEVTVPVDNISALKALMLRPSTVILKGFSTPNDGGGGTLEWIAGDTSTPNDGTIIQCTNGPSGRYKRIYEGPLNVLWWGNSAAALTAAFAVGNIVKIPVGYTLTINSDVSAYGKTFILEGSLAGTGKITGALVIRNGGNTLAVGQNALNSGADWQGLQIGGGNPNMGTDGTVQGVDGFASWLRFQPSKNESPFELCLYPTAAQGRATANSGTNQVTRVWGTPFTSAWIGMNFYLGENIYVVASVISSNAITVNDAFNQPFTFSSTFTETYHVFSVKGTGICNVSGNTVTRVSGDPFIPFITSPPFKFEINGNPVTVTSWLDVNTYVLSAPPGNVTGAAYEFELHIAHNLTAIRVQKLLGTSEENLNIIAQYDGYHIRSQFAGDGQYRKIVIGSGDYGDGVLRRQIVVQKNGDLTIGGDYGAEAIKVLASNNVPSNRFETIAAPSGFAPGWRARGVDANVGFGIDTQGNGATTFTSHQFGSIEFQIFGTGGTSYLAANSGSNADPVLSAQGSATDIDIVLTPKNDGNLRITTDLITTASGTVPVSVDNLATLKALTKRPKTVYMKCRTTAGDGGEGEFTWFPGDSTTADDALIVQCTSGPAGRYKRIFVPGEYQATWWGVIGDGVTSCDAALKKAAASAVRGTLFLPRGRILLTGTDTVHLVNIRFSGMGAMNWSNADTDDYVGYQHLGDFGTTFLITSTTQQPFTVDNSVTIEHCNFYWPNQTGQTAQPIVYPPLITDRGVNYDNSGGVSNNVFINCSVVNAYDFLKQSTQMLTWGSWRILFSDIYAVRRVFSLATVAEQFMIVGCVFNMSLFFEGVATVFTGGISNGSGGAGTILNVTHVNSGHMGLNSKTIGGGTLPNTTLTAYLTGTGLTGTYTVTPSQFTAPGTNFFFASSLGLWTRANGDWLHVWGNGTPSQASTTLVGGLAGTNNIVYGYRRAVYVETGCLDFATFDPSNHFDGSPQVLYVGNSGHITHTRFLGSYYSFPFAGDETNLACFEIDNPAANGPTGGCNIEISGDLRGGNGTFFKAIGNNINRIEMTQMSVGNWGGSSTVGTYYGTYISAPNADVRISASNYFTGSGGTNGTGIYVPSSKSLLIDGIKIRGANRPIDFTGNSNTVFITGVQTLGTQSQYSIYGTQGDNITFGFNDIDKSYTLLDGVYRIGSRGLAIYIASQAPGEGSAPYTGYNIWQQANGTWTYGKGSAGHYGASIRLDSGGGNLGFFMTSTGGTAGGSATMNQYFYMSATDGTLYQAAPVRVLSAFRAQNIGTTASSSNAFLDNADGNNLLRSTSSMDYKKDVEPLNSDIADKVIAEAEPIWYRSKSSFDNPLWSWYGFGAEQIATIEPRLVHWSYKESDYEEIVVKPESSTYEAQPDGTFKEVITEKVIEKRLKQGSVKSPDGIMYDRLTVMLVDKVRRLDETIRELQESIEVLKNKN